MDTSTKNNLTDMTSEALRHVSLGDLARAEESYQHIIPVMQQQEGTEAASRELYNLSNVRIQQQEYSEAESILRDLLVPLAQRPVDEDTVHFLEQEAGSVRMLSQSLSGQSKVNGTLQDGFKDVNEQMQARGTCYGLLAN
ncbi:hypothetical protein AUEXF2481DRAFT_35187 [Aureobasidium subglaciale EXF-2481]|uniref:Uncharacterized protein n=1 Tax=Aureobasidium subglaciale (strain EXF-2481) TaxID=1043005 RepID=A0A074YT46_AURSE|nr:uncharacterized protein AUEXF2481DRAFT_35187 [Aureobasidium subglaciale EXF-2481]KER00929.1 hypothetical protein AUEXF2481DRAFT_35187 [Aureobasidium subglaciale EXF-2481]